MLPTWKELKGMLVTIFRGGLIGIIVGVIPGTGGDTACWFSYNEAKRFSKHKEKFGMDTLKGSRCRVGKQCRRRWNTHSYPSLRDTGKFFNSSTHGSINGPRDYAGSRAHDKVC